MANLYSGTIKYSTTKNCFVTVPASLLKGCNAKDIKVFQVFGGSKKNIFVSCQAKPDKAHSGNYLLNTQYDDNIEINEKFALKLGLHNGSKVSLCMSDSFISKAEKIFLTPSSEDDWKIVELNKLEIESNLLNQIRVVYKGLQFPIWIKQISIFVKISQVIPDQKVVLLDEGTLIDIEPKLRHSSEKRNHSRKYSKHKSLKPNSIEKTISSDSPQHQTDTNDIIDYSLNSSENKSDTKSVLSLFRYVVSSVFPTEQEINPIEETHENIITDLEPSDIDISLRVFPYIKDKLPLSIQATTAFISASTYVSATNSKKIPFSIIAKIEKILSPEEKKKIKNSNREDKSLNDNTSGKFSEKIQDKTVEEKTMHGKILHVHVVIIHSSSEDKYDVPKSLFYDKNIIIIPRELQKSLNLEVSSLVRCQGVSNLPTALKKLTVHPIFNQSKYMHEYVIDAFKSWIEEGLINHDYLLISDGTLANLEVEKENKMDFLISLKENDVLSNSHPLHSLESGTSSNKQDNPEMIKEKSYFKLINKDLLPNIQIIIGNHITSPLWNGQLSLPKNQDLYQKSDKLYIDSLGGIKLLADQAIEAIEFWLKLKPSTYVSNHPFSFYGCLLVCGPKGVGKSAFVASLCKKFMMYPYHVYVQNMHCLPLKGKRVDTIIKKWDAIMMEAIHRQPSIIVFEDLDYIASSPTSHEQEIGPEAIYFLNIVQAFVHFLNKILLSQSRIVVLVTAQSMHSLHPSLANTKGRHVFQNIVEIFPPNVKQREEIIQSLILNKLHISETTIKSIEWENIALKTEGYVAQDLHSLVDRAIHAAWIRNECPARIEDSLCLIEKDFEIALEGYAPAALRGLGLQTQEKKTWHDVGGLNNVKKVIQEIIMWPLKYKEIFRNYNLKPQMNVLLYGPPGTGKTLIASVVANTCGLNFISIKGPELLSKYIGASEQAIRDLFQRALSAKPCILFFDEFDSIAPRRGHDSTGVTDRVVNQLLTQLDGVELLEGVHVLAATSRPELIDPALLRPGRLDKCLLCPLPDEKERLEILNCLSSRLPLSEDVDFEPLIPLTKHFSGADLQALLYTAHIEALHDAQKSKSRRYSDQTESKLLYIPSLEEGIKPLSCIEEKKITPEANITKENYLGFREGRQRRHSMLNVSIRQKHLTNVAKNMKPSVSAEERSRYEQTYENFLNAIEKKNFTKQTLSENIKKVTLA